MKMNSFEKIKDLWDNECLSHTKDIVLDKIAKNKSCAANTSLSARQRYFYAKNISTEEAPVILKIMGEALKEQNKRIEDKLIPTEY